MLAVIGKLIFIIIILILIYNYACDVPGLNIICKLFGFLNKILDFIF